MPDFIAQTRPTMYFIGVTTTKSSIMQVFPLWGKELGCPDVVLEGVDLKLHDDPRNYRQVVERIKNDPLSLGALVTTHKINLFEAARDLFDFLDPYATLCGEVSCISKQKGRLEGHAKDPITSGLALGSLLGPGYFGRTGGHILCLGAGGAATALVLHLASQPAPPDRPRRFIVVSRSDGRLRHLRETVSSLNTGIEFDYHCHADSCRNDEIMSRLPPASLVINATGMGKDLPGSPITPAGVFPERGIAWELNYRGELDFLHLALAQRESRALTVEDGWVYFLHGWTQVIAQVLKVEVGGPVFDRLSQQAAAVCTPALPPRQYSATQPLGLTKG